MPTDAVSVARMGVGKKGTGKHWTAAEVEARQRADAAMRRERVTLRIPDWLPENARRVWYYTVRKARALHLYDDLDAETLAVYCVAVAEHRRLTLEQAKSPSNETLKLLQSQARLVFHMADKLGLTPQSRARLTKRLADQILAAEEAPDEFD